MVARAAQLGVDQGARRHQAGQISRGQIFAAFGQPPLSLAAEFGGQIAVNQRLFIGGRGCLQVPLVLLQKEAALEARRGGRFLRNCPRRRDQCGQSQGPKGRRAVK